jgi:hypothetical protein
MSFEEHCSLLFNDNNKTRILSEQIGVLNDVQSIDLEIYKSFVDFFKSTEVIDKKSMLIAMNFTYGWMPTMLKLPKGNIANCIDTLINILNKAKSCVKIDNTEFQLLKSNFNNSVVGTSKLLHFINPDIYPILDSKILEYLTSNKYSVLHHINKVELYEKYMNFCNQMTSISGFMQFKSEVCKKLGVEVSSLRAIEIVMYYKQLRRPLI